MANAFASPTQDKIANTVSPNLEPMSQPFVSNRVKNAVTTIETNGQQIQLKHGSGAMQGDSVANELFSAPYEHQIAEWLEQTRDETLEGECPFTGKPVGPTLTLFIDDILCLRYHYPITIPVTQADGQNGTINGEYYATGDCQITTGLKCTDGFH